MALTSSRQNLTYGETTTVTLTDLSLSDATSVAYTITGVTSSEINGQSLTGNFIISSGTASFDLTASVEKFRLISIKAAGYDPITLAVYNLQSGPELVVEDGIVKQAAQFNIPGTYTWTVPAGVTQISATVIGGGGGGRNSTSGGSGGGGGDLRRLSISVTPGTVYDITVGIGGSGGTAPTSGGFSEISLSGTPILTAAGGGAGRPNNTSDAKNGTSTALGSGVTGGDGGIGIAAGSTSLAGGGGGAGGYSGNGGNGGGGAGSDGAAGSGGGGGGGGAAGSGLNAGSGGGVGLYGPGISGAAGVFGGGGGGGGSSGQEGRAGSFADSNYGGGSYGGGGGGADNNTATNFSPGGTGAVAITYAASAGISYRSAIPYGENVDIFVTTENVQDGTEVAYTITGVSSSDIGNFPLTGNVTIYNNTAYLGFLPTVNSPRMINVNFTGRGSVTISLYEFSQGPKLLLESGEIKLATQFTTPGSYTWTPPAGVTQISATLVGGGGGGMSNGSGGSGGGGGDLRQSLAIPVTVGTVYDITVGLGGSGGTVPTAGGFSEISLASAPLLTAAGGGAGRTNNTSDAKNGTSSPIGPGDIYVGQQEFTTPGTTSWTAPPGVTSVCVVCVGGGGAGYGNDQNGGGGGGLGWKNNIAVVPGTTYTVVVGSGGSPNSGQGGTDSYFIDTSTVAGFGGQGSGVGGVPLTVQGGSYIGDGGGNGGNSNAVKAGGGGAGGYSGNGGNGGGFGNLSPGSPGQGGGGGGGGGPKTESTFFPDYLNQAGGGVGIYGEGASGAGGTTNIGGGGGSGGEQVGSVLNLGSLPGARYGGGGASNKNNTYWGGGDGAVRIIWGPGRSFPSSNTADQTPSSGVVVTGGDGGIGRASGSAAVAGGGGGAGGYSGNGGDGAGGNGFQGRGGGGGGGSGSGTTQTAGSGGGVGLYGQGPDGAGGIYDATAGNPGGGGSSGVSGENGAQSSLGIVFSQNLYGGGGAGQDNTTASKFRNGGNGAVVIRYTAPPGLYASEDEIVSGYGFTVTLVTDGESDGSTFQYTISGVTSAEINGAPLTGVFTVYNNIGTINLTGNVPSSEYRSMTISVIDSSSKTIVIRGFLHLFSPNYQPLIENFQGTKKFIDLRRGSNSNDGNSYTAAWASLYYAMETTGADTNPVMFIIAPGDYYLSPVYTSSFASWSITDNGQPRTFVCVPGRVSFIWTAGSQRDAALINLGNSSSEVYGARFFRNNGGKGLSYSVAIINNSTALMRGKLYNCLITETNPNGNWSFTYGVPPASPAVELRNCTLYFQQTSTGDYNVATNLQLIDGVSTVALTNTLATKTNFLESAPVEPIEYRVPFEYSRGVYSGTYRWIPLTEKILLSRETLEERQSFSAVYESRLEISRTESYTLSGVSSDDIVGGNLTGNFTTENYRGSFLIVTRADYDFNEGTETIQISIDGATASVTLTDLPSALFFDQPVVSAGEVVTATLIVNNLSAGTLIPYTISGVTQEALGDFPLTGHFIIDGNNTGEISFGTGTIPGATLSISADGNIAVCQVNFSAAISTPTTIAESETSLSNISPRIIKTIDFVDQLKFPVKKTVSEVDQSTGTFVIRPLGVELVREYWI